MDEFKKQRAREARKSYKEKRKACSDDSALETPQRFRIKSLDDIYSQAAGDIFTFIQEGETYASKASLSHEICELAECLCLTIVFPKNTKYELVAQSQDFHGTQPRPLYVHGTFRLSENV